MLRRTLIPMALTVALVLGACDDGAQVSEPSPTIPLGGGPDHAAHSGGGGGSRVLRALRTELSCDEVLEHVRDEALDRVTAWGLDGEGPIVLEDMAPAATEAPAETEAPAAEAPDSGSSDTNTQVAGVDEGDLVETDGRYLYTVIGSVLQVIDPGSDQGVVGELSLDASAYARQMVLADGHLVVVESVWGPRDPVTIVTSISVADPADPEVTATTRLEGEVVAVRAVEGQYRLVMRSPLGHRLPLVQPRSWDDDSEDEALKVNRRAIRDADLDDWLPRLITIGAGGSVSPAATALECGEVAIPSIDAGFGITWLVTGPIDGSVPGSGAAAVIARGETVMATADSLYVGTVAWPEPTGDVIPIRPDGTTTELHRFSISSDGSARYEASGEVAGLLLNQFSMDEYDGVLRVAVTGDGSDFEMQQASAVVTFAQQGDELAQLGAVGGLGVGEQIRSVRFIADQAYVVTFRQTDPLYVLDLSDPVRPRMTGELKVPGYSAYLHPVGDGLLLGVGQDADDTGRVRGTKVSLFDVSDPTNPIERSTLPIGTTSEIEWDHHAFGWWGATSTAMIPTEAWFGGLDGGVIVADVVNGSLVERGRVRQQREVSYPGEDPVRRSLIIDGDLVTVSGLGVQVSDLATLAPIRFIATR